MENSPEGLEGPRFLPPRATEWKPLTSPNKDEALARHAAENRQQLHDTLLASLQMPNLVVLAGSGCSLSAGAPSMLDLWEAAVGEPATDEAMAVASSIGHKIDDRNIEALLSRVEAALQLKHDDELARFLAASKNVILDRCSAFLTADKLEAHRKFIHRLSRRRVRDPRLKVFTTNYDLCFETTAGVLGTVVLDGFSFTGSRHYDPRYFSYDIVRRPRDGGEVASYLEGVFLLYKLHGSVNWARKADGTIQEETQPRPEEACLIYPASGKYQQSYTQPHLEAIAQYLMAVREPNTCVIVVGFGFQDSHLGEPLLAAATSNPNLRLIIVDPSADRHVADGKEYWARLAALAVEGADVWLLTANFAQFATIIPDLKSLSPADTLMRAIRTVAKGP